MKKLLCFFLVMTLLFSFTSTSAHAENDPKIADVQYSDMPDNWSTKALQRAISNGLLQGYNGKIMPDAYLTRAQMAAVIVRAFGANAAGDISRFSDVASTDWFAKDIAKAYQMGVIKGTGEKMHPNSPITREEVFVIAARAMKLQPELSANETFSDINEVSQWAKGEVNALINKGYVNGSNGKLYPKGLITRAEFSQLFDNLIKQYLRTGGTVTSVSSGNILVSVPGVCLKDVTVSGDLIVGDGVGDGELILDNVKINGRLVIRGGGKDSIIIRGDSSIGHVVLSKNNGAVSVKILEGAKAEVIYIDDGSDDVFIEGEIGTLSIQAADILVMARNADIDKIDVMNEKLKLDIDENSTVASIKINNKAKNSNINVSGKVLDINSSAVNVHITGDGSVLGITIQAGGGYTTVNTVGTRITVEDGAVGVNCRGVRIEPGTTITSNDIGTGNISPSPTPTPTVALQDNENAGKEPTNPVEDEENDNIPFIPGEDNDGDEDNDDDDDVVIPNEPVADHSVLKATIDIANNKKENAKIGDEPGNYTNEAVENLAAAIEEANLTDFNLSATQDQINAAVNILKEAIISFELSMITPENAYVLVLFYYPDEGTVTVSEAVYGGMAVTDAVYFYKDQIISIEALPEDGYHFTGWLHNENKLTTNPYTFKMPGNHVVMTANFAQKQGFDTFILRKDADFNVELSDGIYWVPANSLGAPEYTRDEVRDIISTGDPEYIKNKINTLYDAIQYFYLSSFRVIRTGEHKDIQSDGVYWQTHKSGVEALMTNEGDSSGVASLIHYLLEGDYDDVGYLACSYTSGYGNVFNYIKQGDVYYFIDFYGIDSAYIEEEIDPTNKYFGANLIKAQSISQYTEFFKRMYAPGVALFNTHTGDRVAPIGFKNGTYYFPENVDFTFYPTEINVPYVITRSPSIVPTWKYDEYPQPEAIKKEDIEVLIAPNYERYYNAGVFSSAVQFSLKRNGSLEFSSMVLDYYTSGNEFLKREVINESDILRYNLNNYIFNRRSYPFDEVNQPLIIRGRAIFYDIFDKRLEVDFVVDYTEMQSDINKGVLPEKNIAPSEYDRAKLRYNASYKLPLYNGVFWVPVNTLGKPQLTAEQLKSIPKSADELKQEINTLYDAITYVQEYNISRDDRKFLYDDNVIWEHYQTIEDTIAYDIGGSGVMSNLLHYFLADDYDEVGYLVCCLLSGEYEILNYIRENEKYYVFSLNSNLNSNNKFPPETGSYYNLRISGEILGPLYEADSLESFFEYFRTETIKPPVFVAAYTADNIYPVGRIKNNDKTELVFPNEIREKLTIIYDNPGDLVSYNY